jgi:serine/threonine protein kinase
MDHPNIIKLIEVFDNRTAEGMVEKHVHFVYELASRGALEDYLKLQRMDEARDSPVSKEQFLKWGLSMARTVQYLHEKKFIIHLDLHIRNWFLREDLDIVLGDFGCAKVLGEGGKVPKGMKIWYYQGHSAPDMRAEEGKGKDKTTAEFSFNGDTWQLGFAFQAILNEGHWDRPTPSYFGQDIVDLINWMHTEDPGLRPQLSQVAERIELLQKNLAHEISLPYTPKTELLFDSAKTDQDHLKQFWQQNTPFSFASSTAGKPLHNGVKINEENLFGN